MVFPGNFSTSTLPPAIATKKICWRCVWAPKIHQIWRTEATQRHKIAEALPTKSLRRAPTMCHCGQSAFFSIRFFYFKSAKIDNAFKWKFNELISKYSWFNSEFLPRLPFEPFCKWNKSIKIGFSAETQIVGGNRWESVAIDWEWARFECCPAAAEWWDGDTLGRLFDYQAGDWLCPKPRPPPSQWRFTDERNPQNVACKPPMRLFVCLLSVFRRTRLRNGLISCMVYSTRSRRNIKTHTAFRTQPLSQQHDHRLQRIAIVVLCGWKRFHWNLHKIIRCRMT